MQVEPQHNFEISEPTKKLYFKMLILSHFTMFYIRQITSKHSIQLSALLHYHRVSLYRTYQCNCILCRGGERICENGDAKTCLALIYCLDTGCVITQQSRCLSISNVLGESVPFPQNMIMQISE